MEKEKIMKILGDNKNVIFIISIIIFVSGLFHRNSNTAICLFVVSLFIIGYFKDKKSEREFDKWKMTRTTAPIESEEPLKCDLEEELMNNKEKEKAILKLRKEDNILQNLSLQINKFLRTKCQNYSWDFLNINKAIYNNTFQISGKIGNKQFIANIEKNSKNVIQSIFFENSTFKGYKKVKQTSVVKTPKLPQNYDINENAENWISLHMQQINESFNEALKEAILKNTAKNGYSVKINKKDLPEYKEVWDMIGTLLKKDEYISSYNIEQQGLTLSVK